MVETHFFGPDTKYEKIAGTTSLFQKWKNINAVKRALKNIFTSHTIKMHNKSEFTIENISLQDCKSLITRFNTLYNEQFNNFEITGTSIKVKKN